MFYVYILQSLKHQKFYTGYTDNIVRRLAKHNGGKSEYTSRYRPWRIVYQDMLETEEQAIARERYFKSAAGRRWIKKQMLIT